MRIMTLAVGTIVRMHKADPALPKSGLVDVEVNGQDLSMFIQDLESRAERVEETTA